MSALMKTFRMVGIAVGAAAAVVILGCGDDSGLATRYKVSGTVKYKGQPVPKGSIVFEPTTADAAGSGRQRDHREWLV